MLLANPTREQSPIEAVWLPLWYRREADTFHGLALPTDDSLLHRPAAATQLSLPERHHTSCDRAAGHLTRVGPIDKPIKASLCTASTQATTTLKHSPCALHSDTLVKWQKST